ncbi:MAG TPA: GAF domain-containing protein [Anaerolineales bacterium]
MINALIAWFRSVFAAPSAANPATGWRGPLVRLLLTGALLVGLLSLAPAFAVSTGMGAAVAIGTLYVVLGAILVLRAKYRLQLLGLITLVFTLGLAALLNSGNPSSAIFYFLLCIVFATLIWSLFAGVAVAAIALLTLGLAGIWMQFGGLTVNGVLIHPAPLAEWISSVSAIMIAAIAVIAGFQQIQREFTKAEKTANESASALQAERANLEERVDARTVQWRAVLEVGRIASSIHDPEELTARVVDLISDRFGYYYAAIFLLNEAGDSAVLHSATGEAGRLLKENRHALPVSGRSMVGTAITSREPRIALDTDAEAVRFANPLLPYTRSEIAVPLVSGDRVIGALDVQSTSPGAFGQPEIDTLQGMANLVAIAFENARLYQQSSRSLDELEAVQRQYIVSAWQPLSDRHDLAYSLGEDELPSESPRIEVPLSLRDQIIGEINLSSESDWTPEQRNLVEAIATQASLALENARLVEATQSTAQREHLLAEITGKVWSSASREGILQTAIGELGRAMGAEHAVIQLSTEGAIHPELAFAYSPQSIRPTQPEPGDPQPGSLRVPLEFRGQAIGSISIARPATGAWTEPDRDLAQKTADQVALALENVRLLEETRERAAQEQMLSEFSAHLSQSVDLDTLLQTAVRELAKLSEVSSASVFLTPSAPSTSGEPS